MKKIKTRVKQRFLSRLTRLTIKCDKIFRHSMTDKYNYRYSGMAIDFYLDEKNKEIRMSIPINVTNKAKYKATIKVWYKNLR